MRLRLLLCTLLVACGGNVANSGPDASAGGVVQSNGGAPNTGGATCAGPAGLPCREGQTSGGSRVLVIEAGGTQSSGTLNFVLGGDSSVLTTWVASGGAPSHTTGGTTTASQGGTTNSALGGTESDAATGDAMVDAASGRVVVASCFGSRSTNTPSITVIAYDDDSADRSVGPLPNPSLQWVFPLAYPPDSPEVQKLVSDLTVVGDVSTLVSTPFCSKSASFGTTTSVTFAGRTSSDLQCVVDATAAQAAVVQDCYVLLGLTQ